MRNNVLVATASIQDIFSGRGASARSAAGIALRWSLISRENVVFSPQDPSRMNLPWRQRANLTDWQSLTNKDASSLFADPRFLDPENHKFALLPDSPILRMNAWRSDFLPPLVP